MSFSLIGMGLGDLNDITIKGFNIAIKSDVIYLEAYTSILIDNRFSNKNANSDSKVETDCIYSVHINGTVSQIAKRFGKEILIASRELVESGDVLTSAIKESKHVSLLVIGDPLSATTHTDLILRCKKVSIPVEVVHNTSIMNAVSSCGAQLYKFGQCISICFWTETWKPMSFFPKIQSNLRAGLHTLCLLDIKVREISDTNLARGKVIYEPPRFMTVNQSLDILLKTIEHYRAEGDLSTDCINEHTTIFIGVARLGSSCEHIAAGTISTLSSINFGPPLHSLVICSKLHPLEAEFIAMFAVDDKSRELILNSAK